MRKAFITGIGGQDGSYLAEYLLDLGYEVHGIIRRNSTPEHQQSRLDGIRTNPNLHISYGDLLDTSGLERLLSQIQPDEIYNLAAQSHVAVSFEQPDYTANTDALGVLRILDAIKNLGLEKKVKFYQAGTSEMFGKVQEIPQTEKTPFYPRSPYGVAKLYAHWIVKNYREAYGLFASNGILFNHESPLRGETFVTQKIIKALVRIKYGLQKKLILGNLYAKRDWGHARDYVEAIWLVLQHKKPDDFVIATGKNYSIKTFIKMTCKELGIKIQWKGKRLNEKAFDKHNNIIIECSEKYLRPTEVDNLLGNAQKAKKILNWRPRTSLKSLIKEMIESEISNIKKLAK
jgi:GDPmannose 4,6-dehydratase